LACEINEIDSHKIAMDRADNGLEHIPAWARILFDDCRNHGQARLLWNGGCATCPYCGGILDGSAFRCDSMGTVLPSRKEMAKALSLLLSLLPIVAAVVIRLTMPTWPE
jgi:hypothetical protein